MDPDEHAPRHLHGADTCWDSFDHVVALTDRSMVEALNLSGFEVESSISHFLPFTMAGKRRPPTTLIRASLRFPPAWRFLGRQFLVARRTAL